jgi:hypothetical protein
MARLIAKFNKMPQAERYRALLRDIFFREPVEYSTDMKQSVCKFLIDVMPCRESMTLQMIYNLSRNPDGRYCESIRDIIPFVYNKVKKERGISRNRFYVVWGVSLRIARYRAKTMFPTLESYLTAHAIKERGDSIA